MAIGADSAPSFAVDTVKDNSFPPLYGVAGTGEDPGLPDLRTAFTNEFVAVYTEQMTSLDRTPASGGQGKDGNELLLDLGAAFENRFNGFQSVAQGNEDNPATIAVGTTLPDRITGRLDELGLSDSCQLTQEHVLNRAGALSCGGCHQFTAGQPVAPKVTWPRSAGFVHITEQSVVSPALEDNFLPGRRAKLEEFLAEAPAVAAATPEAPTAAREAAQAMPGVQRQLERFRTSETRIEAIEALGALEAEVRTARDQDQKEPGAFVAYRRAH